MSGIRAKDQILVGILDRSMYMDRYTDIAAAAAAAAAKTLQSSPSL